MANFDRLYHQNIIVNRIDITSKYGLRFITIDKDSSWGEGEIINLSISTEDSLNDIPLIKEIKRDTAEIPLKLMAFDELGNPKKINDNFLREVTRVLYGGDKNAKEVRIGDYLYYGHFRNIKRVWKTATICYLSCTFKMASPNVYSIKLMDTIAVLNGANSIQISNRSNNSEFLYPDIVIRTQSKCNYIIITNANDSSIFKLTDIPKNAYIYFYGDNINQLEDKNKNTNIDYFDKWNLNSLRLVYGINTIQLSSDGQCDIEIVFQNELSLF